MITVENLSFSYAKSPFISGMNFSVSKGEIFGFLGPSGAGKSTLQKILIGMLRTYQGSCRVNGVECKKRAKRFYEDIGVDFEFSTMYEKLTARENLQFFAHCFRCGCPVFHQIRRAISGISAAFLLGRKSSFGKQDALYAVCICFIRDMDVVFIKTVSA